jgi:protease-4
VTRATRRRAALVALAALTIGVGCKGRPKSSGAIGSTASAPRTGPEVAVLDLSGGAPEIEAAGFLGVAVHRASFDRFLGAVRTIGDDKDKDIKGVFVRFGDARIGIARAEEIGDLLAHIRETKPVYCHAEGFGNATLYAAARGCSKIYVSPAGGVEAIGIAAQVVYFHKLLTEELHITVDFLQVGKFKGAEEPFTRDGPSDEARASLTGALTDIRSAWIDGVKKGRTQDGAADAAEDGPYSPNAAKAKGLIDEVAYSDDALEALKKTTGAVRDETRFGSGSAEKDDDVSDIIRMLAGSHGGGAPIALIRASGSIAMDGGGSLLGGQSGITEREMSRLLARCEKDDAIKAVVLRIDSPGGSALASDLIWHELRRVHAKKPIVVSMGDLAASGGYYISSAANVIYAEPTSIVGSIGVVGGKIAFGNALEKIGVHAETFAAKDAPGAGARAAYESPLTDWDDATKARVLESMTGVYELFLARVAEGRATTPDKIAPFAEGRIFSGAQAKDHGLVDELGGLRDAIAKARSLASLPADAAVSVMSSKSGLLEAIDNASGGDDDESHAGKAAMSANEPNVGGLVARVAPDLAPFVASLAALEQGERTLAAMPYALVVR